MIIETIATIVLAISLSATPERILLARAVGHEAPCYLATETDTEAVASVIMWRSICRKQSIRDVLFAPGQFSTAYLLDTDPVDMDFYLTLADRTMQWSTVDDLPVVASHFFATTIEPPYWADVGKEVNVPNTVQRYFLLEDCK